MWSYFSSESLFIVNNSQFDNGYQISKEHDASEISSLIESCSEIHFYPQPNVCLNAK